MIHCGLCDDRSFGTQEAFDAHCISAGAHKGRYCKKCKRACRTDAEFQRHVRRDHGPVYKCGLCSVPPFQSCELMQRHFRVSNRHPDCERCTEGVEDEDLLEKHVKSKHPQKQCIVCGIFIYTDELEKHYLESFNHRNCARCNIGFETDQHYDEHVVAVHEGQRSPFAGSPTPSDQLSQPSLRSGVALSGELTMAAHLGRLMSPTTDPPRNGRAFPPIRSDPDPDETASSTAGSSRLPPQTPIFWLSAESASNPHTSSGFQTPVNGVPVRAGNTASSSSLHTSSSSNGSLLTSNSTPLRTDIPLRSPIPTYVNHGHIRAISPTPSNHVEDVGGMSQQTRNRDEPVLREQPAVTNNHAMPALHCRICQANPCINMTSTFCGHIFCNRCITNRILSTPYCPVCDAATLLYMIFKLDLSA